MSHSFLIGLCCEFAWVLHRKSGYPIWAILDHSGCCIAHAFVKVDHKTIIDAKGKRSLFEMKQDVYNGMKFKKINNQLELEAWGGEIHEEAIKQAKERIEANLVKYGL